MTAIAAMDPDTGSILALLDGQPSRLLSDCMPAHLVVDAETGSLVTFNGPAKLFLAPAAAGASLDLFRLLRDDLHAPVRAALNQAVASLRSSRLHILAGDAAARETDLVVAVEPITTACPLPHDPDRAEHVRYFVIGLYPYPATLQTWSSAEPALSRRAHEAEIRLEALHAVIEKMRARNLDLVARNEKLLLRQELSATLLDSTLIATVFLDPEGRIRDFTRATTDIFALRDADIGRPLLDLVCRLDYPGLAADLERVLVTRQQLERELQDRGPEGRVFLMCMRPRLRAGDEPGGLVLTFVDITTRKRIENQAWFLAHHDQLTGLPNRTRFQETLDEIATRMPRPQGWIGLMYLDLDRFKSANDTFGHAVGDMLLQHVAARLRASMPQDAVVYRLGGDEFAIIQHGAGRPVHPEALANRLLEQISIPYAIEPHVVQIGTSIGVAWQSCGDGLDREALARAADLALYQAKAGGRSAVRVFQPQMEEAWQRKRHIERDLGGAMLSGQMSIAFQPIVRIADGRIVGAEALLRWHHPRHGILAPAQFIPAAEASGQIVALGLWVLETACLHASGWDAAIGLSVNLSPVQFASLDLVDKVLDVLRRTGLDPARLTLEVPEDVLLQHPDRTRDATSDLHRFGVAVAVDDFGTGHAALASLHELNVGGIKIHQNLVRSVAARSASAVIVEAIRTISHDLDIRVCAKGVETIAQMNKLGSLGIEQAQGFLLHQPMLPTEFGLLLRSGRSLDA